MRTSVPRALWRAVEPGWVRGRSEPRLRPGIQSIVDPISCGLSRAGYGQPGRAGVCCDKAIDRNSPCSIVDSQKPRFPQPGFSSWGTHESGSIRQGWTFRIGCCRHMRRRNFWLGRILDRSGRQDVNHAGCRRAPAPRGDAHRRRRHRAAPA